MTDYHKGSVDAYYDGLLAKHLADTEDEKWVVVCNDNGEDGFLVIDDWGASVGEVFETEKEAQAYADELNEQEKYDDYYFE